MLSLKRIFLLLFIINVSNLSAQYTEDEVQPYVEPTGMNIWFIELGGSALLWSINYEKYLFRNYNRNVLISGRIGIGYSPINYRLLNSVYLDEGSVAMPFSVSLVLGKGKEKLEFGTGYTLATKNFTEREIFPTFLAGFRVIDNNKTLLKILYTPHYRNETLINWFGVSLGRNF